MTYNPHPGICSCSSMGCVSLSMFVSRECDYVFVHLLIPCLLFFLSSAHVLAMGRRFPPLLSPRVPSQTDRYTLLHQAQVSS
jgi:hypothetical protein